MATQVRITSAVQGARHEPITVDWGIDLDGATITGTKQLLGDDAVYVLDGTFVVSVPEEDGIFVWTLGAGDVGTAGHWLVQFKATFASDYAMTIEGNWLVKENQGAGVVPSEALVGVTESQAAFLDDINITSPTDGQVLTWDDTAGEWVNEDAAGGGASTFLDLTDTPATFVGQAGELVRVNVTEDALEFLPPPYALQTDLDTHAELPGDSISLGHFRLGNGLATDGLGLLSTSPVQQPFSDELTAIDNLTPTDSNIIVGNGTTWVAEGGATARTSLGAAAAADLTSHTGSSTSVHGIADTSALLDSGDIGGTVQGYDADTAKLDVAQNWSAAQNLQDNELIRPKLKDYGVTINAIGSIGGGSQDIDLTLGNVVTATVDTSETTFTFSNPPPAGSEGSFKLYLTNGGSQVINWPVAVNWAGGAAPTLTAAGVDILVFTTPDSGVTWFGFAAGIGMA